MTKQLLQAEDFAASVLDALSSHICVIDKDSLIVAVNRAWRKFTIDNPPVSKRTGIGRTISRFAAMRRGPAPTMPENFP